MRGTGWEVGVCAPPHPLQTTLKGGAPDLLLAKFAKDNNMGELADALNRLEDTGEICEWCEHPILKDRETGGVECECEDE